MTNFSQTKHPTSGNLQDDIIISDKEIKSDNHNKQQFSQKQAPIGAFCALRERGFNPIPIIYGDKKPAIKWTQYQKEQVTDSQFKQWDSGRFNVGIVTGAISGVFVLDVDGEAGAMTLATLEAQYGALPATLTATSGKGKHYYFVYPDDGRIIRNLAGQSVHGEILEGLDVRGEGDYIVAPPSLHPNGKHYQWLNDLQPAPAPDWLLENILSIFYVNDISDKLTSNMKSFEMMNKKWITIIVELVKTIHVMHRKIDELERDLDTTKGWVGSLLNKDQSFVENLQNMPELQRELLEGFFSKTPEEINDDFLKYGTAGRFICDPELDNYEEQMDRFYEILDRISDE